MNSFKLLLVFLVFSWLPANASTLVLSDDGTFSSATASSTFSGPDATWAWSFQADSNPVIFASGLGGFRFAFSNFSYLLNGSPVAIAPSFITFFGAIAGGGFFLCLDAQFCGTGTPPDGWSTGFAGPQMFDGPPSSPSFLAGAFTFDHYGVTVNSTAYSQPSPTTVLVRAVPEPSTLLTVTAWLLLTFGRLRAIRDSGLRKKYF